MVDRNTAFAAAFSLLFETLSFLLCFISVVFVVVLVAAVAVVALVVVLLFLLLVAWIHRYHLDVVVDKNIALSLFG